MDFLWCDGEVRRGRSIEKAHPFNIDAAEPSRFVSLRGPSCVFVDNSFFVCFKQRYLVVGMYTYMCTVISFGLPGKQTGLLVAGYHRRIRGVDR